MSQDWACELHSPVCETRHAGKHKLKEPCYSTLKVPEVFLTRGKELGTDKISNKKKI
jgi:hypothetical protein